MIVMKGNGGDHYGKKENLINVKIWFLINSPLGQLDFIGRFLISLRGGYNGVESTFL